MTRTTHPFLDNLSSKTTLNTKPSCCVDGLLAGKWPTSTRATGWGGWTAAFHTGWRRTRANGSRSSGSERRAPQPHRPSLCSDSSVCRQINTRFIPPSRYSTRPSGAAAPAPMCPPGCCSRLPVTRSLHLSCRHRPASGLRPPSPASSALAGVGLSGPGPATFPKV